MKLLKKKGKVISVFQHEKALFFKEAFLNLSDLDEFFPQPVRNMG